MYVSKQIQNSNNSNLPELQGLRNTNPINMHTKHKLFEQVKFMNMNSCVICRILCSMAKLEDNFVTAAAGFEMPFSCARHLVAV
jgi:hypothetical protein